MSLMLVLLGSARAWTADSAGGLRPWREYKTIMWLGDSIYKQPQKVGLAFQRLREMGINTAMVYDDGDPEPLLTNRFPYYVENVVNRGLCLKFNSQVQDWDKFVTDWAKEGRPESALVRDYCLDDPQWQGWAFQQMQTVVRKNQPNTPLLYNIRDELSTTISANPFDFDFSPLALANFRSWLKTQYPDLTALNAEWETHFASWDDVKPFTTDQIKARMAGGQAVPTGPPDWQELQNLRFSPAIAGKTPTRWNFSPWADFRTYMDISLAMSLQQLRRAAHQLDPATPVGIEGTQMPHAFGGYDLWRLSQVLDWVEPYDIGSAREIFGSFMPGKPLLTTVFETDAKRARRRLWHLLLEGDRGCIVWWSEDCIDWKSTDYQLTPKAKALTPVLNEMTSTLAQLFLRARPERDPVFIHYSQPSVQVDWLLESTVDGSTWPRRFSSFEAEHNRQAKVRTAWLKALQDLGYSPQFISSQQIESGGLVQQSNAVLVLPSSWAISDTEAAELLGFLHAPANTNGFHLLLADAAPGAFDQHGRLRQKTALDGFVPTGALATSCAAWRNAATPVLFQYDCASYVRDRLKQSALSSWVNWIGNQLKTMETPITVQPAACARVHRFQVGNARLLAFERNINYQMSEELKQAGGNEPLEQPVKLEASFSRPAYVYDLRSEKFLGHTDRIQFLLDPWQPSLFGLLPSPIPDGQLLTSLLQD